MTNEPKFLVKRVSGGHIIELAIDLGDGTYRTASVHWRARPETLLPIDLFTSYQIAAETCRKRNGVKSD
jgi:hypothetical protein